MVATGAEVTVEPASFSGFLSSPYSGEGYLTAPAIRLLQVLGTFTTTFEWKGLTSTQRIYVLLPQTSPLFGLPVI